MERDVALEKQGSAEILAGGNQHGSAAACGAGIDRLLNGRCVEADPIANRPEVADVEDRACRCGTPAFRGRGALLTRALCVGPAAKNEYDDGRRREKSANEHGMHL